MSSNSSNVRSLLRDDAGAGYPRAYVLARLRGRRPALAGAAAPALPAGATDADERIWNGFLDELTWLFGQLDAPMRDDYAPLFALFEMKTIVLCLRNASLDRVVAQRQLLERSLLSARLRDILGQPRHIGAIATALGEALGGLSGAFLDLDARYFEGGLKGCEDALMRLYLESLAGTRLAPPARFFLTRFTDLRNLMALYKHLRWALKGPVVLIRGGTIDVSAFKAAVMRDDRGALDALAERATGRRIAANGESALETQLLAALSDALKRARRERGGDWLVPDYIWSAYVHARNRAVRYHAADVEPSIVAREIVA